VHVRGTSGEDALKQGGALREAVLPLWRSAQESKVGLSPRARLLLWDFSRGSLAYDLLLLAVLIVLFAVPASWWNDPMRGWP
jgi:hypothetical protein